MALDLLVVADDLTGALDTAAQFASRGLRTVVSWSSAPPVEAQALALDSETRDLRPQEAGAHVAELAGPHLRLARRLYKKVDSTLRGNVGAELAVLLEASGARCALLAPAFPAQGRITRDGRLWVHGEPLERTPYASPALDCSSIPALLRSQADLPVAMVGLEVIRRGPTALAAHLASVAEPLVVVDAEEEADLATIARAAVQGGEGPLLAGSAGLAAHLPAAWELGGGTLTLRPTPLRGWVLVVAGSRHPCLRGQLAQLEATARVSVVRQALGGLLRRGDEVVGQRARALAEALRAGNAVLTTHGEPLVAGAGRLVAALLAEVTARACERALPGALVLTGGDVAVAVCRALGAEAIAVEGQLEPGIPLGRLIGGTAGGLPVVTKAGGFGDEGVLARIVRSLATAGTEGTLGTDGTEGIGTTGR